MDERRTDGGGKWKIGQCSVGPETAKTVIIGRIILLNHSSSKSLQHVIFLNVVTFIYLISVFYNLRLIIYKNNSCLELKLYEQN